MIAVPSEYVRGTVVDAFGVRRRPRRRWCRTASSRHSSTTSPRRTSCAAGTRSATGPVIVYPAVTHPHKNHRFLLELLRDCVDGPRSAARAHRRPAAAPKATSRGAPIRACAGSGRVPAADRNGLVAMAHGNGLPQPIRGIRRATDRGDDARHPDRRRRRDVHPGGRRLRRDRAAPDARRLGGRTGHAAALDVPSSSRPGRRGRRSSRPRASGAALAAVYRRRDGSPVSRRSRLPAGRLRIAVLCPHFAPDTAPTGEVMTGIVHELAVARPRAARGHLAAVVPQPRRRPRLDGRLVRTGTTAWGSHHPRPPVPRHRQAQPRCVAPAGFVGFSALAGLTALRGGRVDVVLAMSPPFTMGLTGWLVHVVRRGPLVYNIQDVFPDAAIADRCDHRPAG